MPSTQKKKPGQLFEFFSPFQQTHNLGNSYFRTANSLLIEPFVLLRHIGHTGFTQRFTRPYALFSILILFWPKNKTTPDSMFRQSYSKLLNSAEQPNNQTHSAIPATAQ